MAVTQISRIQVRRGRKGIDPIPQLASGEIAWAIDTQELYIGNGSIAEGAPYQGNTKILTEHDNALTLGESYKYYRDSVVPKLESAVYRSVQSRLDEGAVNAANFGIVPSLADCSAVLQTAINEVAAGTRVAMLFDPGEYTLRTTVVIPDNVQLIGSGVDLTTFVYTGTDAAFKHTASSQTATQSRIAIKQCSILLQQECNGIELYNTSHSVFDHIKIRSSANTPLSTVGIRVDSTIEHITSGYNMFNVVELDNLTTGVYGTPQYSQFGDFKLTNLVRGFELGSVATGANFNVIKNSVFDDIKYQGVLVKAGQGNVSTNNSYKNVGADLAALYPVTFVIEFISDRNVSDNDQFERNSIAVETYIPAVGGVVLVNNSAPRKTTLKSTSTPTVLFNFPVSASTTYSVDYIYNSTTYSQSKQGKLTLTVNNISNTVQLVDEFNYHGADDADSHVSFTASIVTTSQPQVSKAIRVFYTNANAADVNTFTYSVSSLA